MSTLIELRRTAAPTRHVSGLLRRYWTTLLAHQQRQRLRGDLSGLSDRELLDMGISRGEIDYVAANTSVDPRGVRSDDR
ncbi:DUF1127 domain-containing protein [Bradyrhizobium sp. Cp5.3]|nr:DUF1127 domain-containing protein [Bradyrhizobium sp. Cp5.3]